MTGLILATHGDFSKAILNAAEMLMGEQEQVCTICFHAGDTLDTLFEAYRSALQQLADCEDILILTDLMGGSPCNAGSVLRATEPKIRIIAGLNMPLLVQFFESRMSGVAMNIWFDTLLEVGRCGVTEITPRT